MNKEGSLEAPTRHPIPWQDPSFYDEKALEAEMERVFDICHGCRRCFNLCESFPTLFDLIDESETGELESVKPTDFKSVVDACTLCDMCFMTKCPYVPPHPFQLDFPHLMLRARAIDQKKGKESWVREQLTQTDRNGKIGSALAPIANWAMKEENTLSRGLMEKTTGIDRRAALPKFHTRTFVQYTQKTPVPINEKASGFGEKVVLYATCFVNYNDPSIGEAALKVLSHNGVTCEVVYPECCGMPQWEQGGVSNVAHKAQRIAAFLVPWVEKGYTIVPLMPSCSLMLTIEWPLLWPENEMIKRVSQGTKDLSVYLTHLARTKGLMSNLNSLPEGVLLHIPCHARAQNQGKKAQELLAHLPDTPLKIVERCSGHGGSWGIFHENFDMALKVGKPVAKQAAAQPASYCVSECPLAAMHIHQAAGMLSDASLKRPSFTHPIQVLAHAYGLI